MSCDVLHKLPRPVTRALVAVVSLACALSASSASAAGESDAAAPVDPVRQVLQKGDLPAGATYESELGLDGYLRRPLKAAGLSGQAGRYYGAAYSRTKGFLQVSGVVITVANRDAARTTFAIVKKARLTAVKDSSDWRPLALPRYGDEQAARLSPPGNEGIGLVELIVRRNRVVWLLQVGLERRPKPPVAEIVAAARSYAAKQQRRVASTAPR